MFTAQNSPLIGKLNQDGFSLLEIILTTGLAAMMMAALMASLMQFNRHKLVAQTIVNQQSQARLASAQILHDWADICEVGVVQGTAELISLKRQYRGRCVNYSYGLNVASHSLKRRRIGGRYSSFLAGVETINLLYGVDTDEDCRIDLWSNRYLPEATTNLHQVWVRLTMRTSVSRQLGSNIEGGWLWHERDSVLLNHLGFIWRVPHVCH